MAVLVGGVICLVNSVNGRDHYLLNKDTNDRQTHHSLEKLVQ